MVGIVNAKRIWQLNQRLLGRQGAAAEAGDDLRQHRHEEDRATRRGSTSRRSPARDIETNPPATNEAVQESGRTFTRQVDELPPADVLDEIDKKVDMQKLEETLMQRGAGEVRRPAEGAKLIAAKRKAP